MVMDENNGTHDDFALFHKAIMAVTCHLGWAREASNGRERTERERGSKRAWACIRAIRDVGLRWRLLGLSRKRGRGMKRGIVV